MSPQFTLRPFNTTKNWAQRDFRVSRLDVNFPDIILIGEISESLLCAFWPLSIDMTPKIIFNVVKIILQHKFQFLVTIYTNSQNEINAFQDFCIWCVLLIDNRSHMGALSHLHINQGRRQIRNRGPRNRGCSSNLIDYMRTLFQLNSQLIISIQKYAI